LARKSSKAKPPNYHYVALVATNVPHQIVAFPFKSVTAIAANYYYDKPFIVPYYYTLNNQLRSFDTSPANFSGKSILISGIKALLY
jgi:hypothetical protein